jgi:plasmid stability protein
VLRALRYHDIIELLEFVLADILIRKVDEATKELLRLRAERRGKSLEADLRDTLEKLAREEAESPDDAEPFGDWLVAISRPGFDLDVALDLLRSAPVRSAPLE